jgi:hypothetical protein
MLHPSSIAAESGSPLMRHLAVALYVSGTVFADARCAGIVTVNGSRNLILGRHLN